MPKSLEEVLSTVWTKRLRPREDGKAVTSSSAKRDLDNLVDQLGAIEITGRAGKGSSGKTILMGEIALKEDDIQEFQDNIEVAKALLETKTMFNLNDLDDARNSLDKLSNKREALFIFMRDNPKFYRYRVIPFSSLTAEHVADMGVTSKTLRQDHRDRVLQVFNAFHLPVGPNLPRKRNANMTPSAIFELFWLELTKDGRYISDFKLLKNNIGKKPEARARMLTDYILTQLMANPIAVRHGNTATLLTGSVDYAILSSAGAKAGLDTSLGVEIDGVEEKIRELNSGGSLDDLMRSKIWPTLLEFKHFKFTIIEEKRKDFGAKKLKSCEPQVIGEALALQMKANLPHVLWCLSNGEDWIFGILSNGLQNRSLPPMSIRDNDLEGSIKEILKALILWTICPVERFQHLLEM